MALVSRCWAVQVVLRPIVPMPSLFKIQIGLLQKVKPGKRVTMWMRRGLCRWHVSFSYPIAPRPLSAQSRPSRL